MPLNFPSFFSIWTSIYSNSVLFIVGGEGGKSKNWQLKETFIFPEISIISPVLYFRIVNPATVLSQLCSLQCDLAGLSWLLYFPNLWAHKGYEDHGDRLLRHWRERMPCVLFSSSCSAWFCETDKKKEWAYARNTSSGNTCSWQAVELRLC